VPVDFKKVIIGKAVRNGKAFVEVFHVEVEGKERLEVDSRIRASVRAIESTYNPFEVCRVGDKSILLKVSLHRRVST
jgi:hypothetical protein